MFLKTFKLCFPKIINMNVTQTTLSLAISVTSLLNSAVVLTTALAARAEAPKVKAAAQIIAQASPSLIERTWQPDNNKFRVQFFKENNIYNGKIVWLPPGAETKDVKNPDPNLRSRNLIGSVMFKGFTYDPDKKQWTGGTLYIPERGGSMKPKLWMEGADRLKVKISMGMMSRTLTLAAIK
jgi:uncharacterized protein (DUF2147 family)